jgi:hypothetical protein
LKLPEDLIARVYAAIDHEAVLRNLRPRINKLVADMILRQIRQTLAEATKAAMNDSAIRERLKASLLEGVLDGR